MEHGLITEMGGMHCGYLLRYLGYYTEIKTWPDVLASRLFCYLKPSLYYGKCSVTDANLTDLETY